jgi:hypothetical protein
MKVTDNADTCACSAELRLFAHQAFDCRQVFAAAEILRDFSVENVDTWTVVYAPQ